VQAACLSNQEAPSTTQLKEQTTGFILCVVFDNGLGAHTHMPGRLVAISKCKQTKSKTALICGT
jgi:hypothetical protein